MLYYERRFKRKGYRLIAGVDEVGRGPLAGPVVAASVILKTHLFVNRIDDSKKLTPKQRESAFSEIYSKAFVGVGIINQDIIDLFNIREASKFAMKQALDNLCIEPDFVLIDGNMDLDISLPKKEIISGDSKSISIASASIVAKIIRDRIMDLYHDVYPSYDFNRNKGYGTLTHVNRLKRFGPCLIHRKSFNKVFNA